jgi:hypothetical protein
MNLRSKALAFLSLPFFLVACEEGWETKSYSGVPYTHERTAGFGLAYVRAKMMPVQGFVNEVPEETLSEVDMNTVEIDEPAADPVEVEYVEPEPEIKPADSIFNSAIRK